jgi:16S rRNA (uracil1498-N3)-methyltransferase
VEREAVTIPRIYLPQPLDVGDTCAVAEDRTRYLTSVLRMQEGDRLIAFNGSDWEYDAVLGHTQAGALSLEITHKRPIPFDEIEITLCQAIPKVEKMDGIIRHATELGARRIIPFLAARSIPRWPAAKGPQKRERWRKIAIEAARQCGRIDVPEIGEISSFVEMLGDLRSGALGLIPWEEEAGRGIREVLRAPRYNGTKSFQMVIGPEGGFTREEVDRARGAGYVPVSLGRRVLRVETAALAVLAILQYERGATGSADTGKPL